MGDQQMTDYDSFGVLRPSFQHVVGEFLHQQQVVFQTQSGCPPSQLNFDTIFLEIVSDPIGVHRARYREKGLELTCPLIVCYSLQIFTYLLN